MKTISKFNREMTFGIEFKESRIKKSIEIIRKMTPGLFLDIGCSDGSWGSYWKNKGWKCFGTDINPGSIESAGNKGIEAKICDLNKDPLPFGDKIFDLIFAGEVIEHLIDTDGFLKEIYRCLKPEGKLLLTTPNLVSFENRLRMFLGRYPMWVDYSLNGSGHVRAYNPRVLKKQLIENGFLIKIHTGNWVPFLPQSMVNDIDFPCMSITGTLFPNIAMDIIILAEKT
ncbi:MAG: class I SAM-dependent methyltransferase [bacterium]|nr:class I SAM-dependent methyltransferase [bacterium]